MAAPKRSTHIVTHKKLYLAVEGKLQHVKEGTHLVLTDKEAERLGNRVTKIDSKDAIDMTGGNE